MLINSKIVNKGWKLKPFELLSVQGVMLMKKLYLKKMV